MREHIPSELMDKTAKFQLKARERIQSWLVQQWGVGRQWHFSDGQEAEKMSTITTHAALQQCLHGRKGLGWFKVFTPL